MQFLTLSNIQYKQCYHGFFMNSWSFNLGSGLKLASAEGAGSERQTRVVTNQIWREEVC